MDKITRKNMYEVIEQLIFQDLEEPEYTYSETKPDDEIPFIYLTKYFDKNDVIRKVVFRDSDGRICSVYVYDDQNNEVYSCGCSPSKKDWNVLYLFQCFRIEPNRSRTLRIDFTNDPPAIVEE